ncbi:hypothetical protein BDN72DRAFT_834300 [Pluteus cervinus]|uniref:Uncharacterized protein n=1 Tax=Pluteus cervinus TaxID=181527 RepID=A0ACD3B6J9_9AGAR|nr:hypothetical protein BDN72DRAFT_834300 [Pluteus cervinus]
MSTKDRALAELEGDKLTEILRDSSIFAGQETQLNINIINNTFHVQESATVSIDQSGTTNTTQVSEKNDNYCVQNMSNTKPDEGENNHPMNSAENHRVPPSNNSGFPPMDPTSFNPPQPIYPNPQHTEPPAWPYSQPGQYPFGMLGAAGQPPSFGPPPELCICPEPHLYPGYGWAPQPFPPSGLYRTRSDRPSTTRSPKHPGRTRRRTISSGAGTVNATQAAVKESKPRINPNPSKTKSSTPEKSSDNVGVRAIEADRKSTQWVMGSLVLFAGLAAITRLSG